MQAEESLSAVAWSWRSRWSTGPARLPGTLSKIGSGRRARLPGKPRPGLRLPRSHSSGVLLLTTAVLWYAAAPAGVGAQTNPPTDAQAGVPEIIRDSIPGTLVAFELVAVPGGTVVLPGVDGPDTVVVEPFYMGRTEVTWDMYDVFWLGLDEPEDADPDGADAVARPSMPYSVPDYGWGHAGYAAINIAYPAAQAFTEWLSQRTGHSYRLATEAEWVHAAIQAAGGPELSRERADALAWHRDNADGQAHAVASREPDGLGLYDLFGNVAEWVASDHDPPLALGGSFLDDPGEIGPFTRRAQQPRWTERDPQIPRSRWWLTDGPFVGFRIVRNP